MLLKFAYQKQKDICYIFITKVFKNNNHFKSENTFIRRSWE